MNTWELFGKGQRINENNKEVDYDDDYQDMVRRVGEKAKAADALKAQGKQPQTKFNPKTGKYYVDFGQDKEVKENAEELNIGDPVIITGNVEFEGTTGEIVEFGQGKRFVIVNLYNHGKHSFHSSDVEYNDHADLDEAGYGRNRGYTPGFASPHAPELGGRRHREDDEGWEQERQAQSVTWYIRVNGKIIKDKMGVPYQYRGKEAATKAARTMMAKPFNAGKKFMLTTNPVDDQPENEAVLHTQYKHNRFKAVRQRDQAQDKAANMAMNRVNNEVGEGRMVKGPGGVPLDRQGRPVPPKVKPIRMQKWLVTHSGSHGEGGKDIIEAPNAETAWETANEYDLDIIDIKPYRGPAGPTLVDEGVAEGSFGSGYGSVFTLYVNTGEKPATKTKTKKFKREDDAVLWAEDYADQHEMFPNLKMEIQDENGNVVWELEESQGVAEGWKDLAVGGAMALGALGAGHAHAADLSGYNTQYLQSVVSGQAGRPMVSVDDAKAELQARLNGKQQRVSEPSQSESSKGYSKEYLQKAADPNRFGRYMISVEKAQELLNKMNEGVAEGNLEEYGDTARGQKMLAKVHHRAADRVTSKQADKDPAYARKAQQTQDRAWDRLAVKEQGVAEGMKADELSQYCEELVAEKGWDAAYKHASFMAQGGTDPSWGSVLRYLKAMKHDLDEAGSAAQQAAIAINMKKHNKKPKDVDEGWKSAVGGAALAGAMALGGSAHAQSGEDFLPDIVAHVTFKVDGNTVTKDINLGNNFKSPGEASAVLQKFLKDKGIKFYDFSIERVKPDNRRYLEKTPASDTGHSGSMDSGPYSASGSSSDYMAKESIDEAIDRAVLSMMEDGYEFTEEKVRLDPKCWKGKKIGNPKTKMKGGVRVNNCVPQ